MKFSSPENGPDENWLNEMVARLPVLDTFTLFKSSFEVNCLIGPFFSVLGLSKKMYLTPGFCSRAPVVMGNTGWTSLARDLPPASSDAINGISGLSEKTATHSAPSLPAHFACNLSPFWM